MDVLAKRLLIALTITLCFSAFVFALSQSVTYKPWGVADSEREKYDAIMADIELNEQVRSMEVPRIQAPTLPHDFGWVTIGDEYKHTFSIRNRGEKPLELTLAGTSGEAVRATLGTNKLAPDGSTTCDVTWTVSDSDTEFSSEKVFLKTNDPLHTNIALTCVGKRKHRVVVPSTIRLGSHDIGINPTTTFLVYSQVYDDFEITAIDADGLESEWAAIEASLDDEQLSGQDVRSAQSVTVKLQPSDHGAYSGKFTVAIQTPDGIRQETISYEGKVRPPVGFYGPEIHQSTGLDLGTLDSGTQHDFYVTVRSRGDKSREIEVLEIQPKALETELTATSQPGAYKLRITVPKGCPDLQFNRSQNRGFVKVGDPLSPSYSSWLPLWVSVSKVDD
ncbi:choice-of-anchor D domain-containing protein [Roseiconus lacunae]|uniref:Choice-of-anchor D domain-containing protein n=1 Tax=Roseiconus lacunae TaxID=2605694 RepID=A0ABT7PPY4_9BACT|nr:choice-of-anchor D domain-containing protein [Roseiconus lacunae]MDM4018562.1 choice-of-anchor D domain-containing protein [Roseiconus lacunae]